jgi:hypothetical protein
VEEVEEVEEGPLECVLTYVTRYTFCRKLFVGNVKGVKSIERKLIKRWETLYPSFRKFVLSETWRGGKNIERKIDQVVGDTLLYPCFRI